MEETDSTEPTVMLSQNQGTCAVAFLSVWPSPRNRGTSHLFASPHSRLQRGLGCVFMAREKYGQASNQGPCRRTQHSDHRCNESD